MDDCALAAEELENAQDELSAAEEAHAETLRRISKNCDDIRTELDALYEATESLHDAGILAHFKAIEEWLQTIEG